MNWETKIGEVTMKDCHRIRFLLVERAKELSFELINALPQNLQRGWCHTQAMLRFILNGQEEFFLFHANKSNSSEEEQENIARAYKEIEPILKIWKKFGIELTQCKYQETLSAYVACFKFE